MRKKSFQACLVVFLIFGSIFAYQFRYQIVGLFSTEPCYRGIPFSFWKKWANEWANYENATNWLYCERAQNMDLYQPPPSKDEIEWIRNRTWKLNDPLANDKEACPLLIELLQEKNRRVRIYSIKKIALLGPGGKEAVPDLIKCLQEDDVVKQYAAITLGKIGQDAQPAIWELLEILRDQRKSYRLWVAKRRVAEAIKKIDREKAAQFDSLLKQTLTPEEFDEIFERHIGIR